MEPHIFKSIFYPDMFSVIGILNVTYNSFSDGGKFINKNKAIQHGLEMIRNGAKIVDVGGESTKPGAQPIEIQEEIDRIAPVIEGLVSHGVVVSVDTRNATTMQAALRVGASVINDVSGLTHDRRSAGVVAQAGVPVVLMHAQGTPDIMQDNPIYNNVIEDISDWFKAQISYCDTYGIDKEKIILDPGIGFGKTPQHNLLIHRNIRKFVDIGHPVLLGSSRKQFIKHIDQSNPDSSQRLGGSLAAVLWSYAQGVKLFRVHDVHETVQALKVYHAISETGLSEDI